MWKTIRKLKRFKLMDLEDATRINPRTIHTYLLGLTNAKYLKQHGQTKERNLVGKWQAIEWELINDIGLEAPRVTKEGKSVTQGQSRTNMWRTMKIMKEFTPRELAMSATTEECEVKELDAKDYIKHLFKAKYIVLVAKSRPGTQARYRFLPSKNTGPQSPMVQRIKQVFDPNLGKVVWRPEL
ncbi:MAG: hypothetical protein GKR93_12145 [Gammaproteobacteria bacterium]|nr:hypothetical protein [Gammaproteobacteria bacterium]